MTRLITLCAVLSLALPVQGQSTEATEANEDAPEQAAGSVNVAPTEPGEALNDAPPSEDSTVSDRLLQAPGSNVGGDASDALDSEGAWPSAQRPELEVRVDNDAPIHPGDLVRLRISATLPEGDDIAVPEQGLDPFEIHRRAHAEVPLEGGRTRVDFELDLLVLQVGTHSVGPIRLRVVTDDGTVAELETEALEVEVVSYLANEPDAQLRGPSEPLAVMEEDYTLAWVAGIVLALLFFALLGFYAARWLNKRPKKPVAAPPPRPPWEMALGSLRTLRRERTSMFAQGQAVELVDQLSDVLRKYLGDRYDFNGLESTSDEVVSRLKKVRFRRISPEEITAILADCDLIKFARATPTQEQTEQMLDGVERIVRATMPQPGAGRVERVSTGRQRDVNQGSTSQATLPVSADTSPRVAKAEKGATRPSALSPAQTETKSGAPQSVNANVVERHVATSMPARTTGKVERAPIAQPNLENSEAEATSSVSDAAREAMLNTDLSAEEERYGVAMRDGSVAVALEIDSEAAIAAELRAAVLTTLLDHRADTSFNGKIRISVTTRFEPSDALSDRLDDLRKQLDTEYAKREIASGRPVSLRVHLHRASLPPAEPKPATAVRPSSVSSSQAQRVSSGTESSSATASTDVRTKPVSKSAAHGTLQGNAFEGVAEPVKGHRRDPGGDA